MSLSELESRSIFMIQEVKAQFKKPAVLWSTGKDSTVMLHLIKKAFLGEVPFPVIHIDTGNIFPEIYHFRDKIAKEWKFKLMIAKNEEALRHGVSPKSASRAECCHKLKIEAMEQLLETERLDVIFMSIRHDEQRVRRKERVMSSREREFLRRYSKNVGLRDFSYPFEDQDAELGQPDLGSERRHVKVHPIFHWREQDVWQFIKKEGLPFNPLYISKNGFRYRNLGCMPCAVPIKSDASSLEQVISEITISKAGESGGRSRDKEDMNVMDRLRSIGYV